MSVIAGIIYLNTNTVFITAMDAAADCAADQSRAEQADASLARDLGPSRTSLPFCGMAIEDRIPLGVDGISDPDDIDGVVCAGGIELIAAAAGADSMTSDGRTAVQCAGLPESDDTVTGNTAGASESARACADGATDTADASKTARDDAATAGASGTNGKTERCETATNSVANVQVNASNEGGSTATGSAEAAIAADAPAPTSDDTDEVAIAEGAPGSTPRVV